MLEILEKLNIGFLNILKPFLTLRTFLNIAHRPERLVTVPNCTESNICSSWPIGDQLSQNPIYKSGSKERWSDRTECPKQKNLFERFWCLMWKRLMVRSLTTVNSIPGNHSDITTKYQWSEIYVLHTMFLIKSICYLETVSHLRVLRFQTSFCWVYLVN